MEKLIHMYSGITSGRVLDGELLYTKICRVDWRKISMKQSAGKCKQINFYNLCEVNLSAFA